MKLLFENWRKYVNETEEQPGENLGAYVKSDPAAWVEITLVNLDTVKQSLKGSINVEDFLQTLQDEEVLNNAVLGFIKAQNNVYSAKADPGMGGSGGACYETWSVKESIGRGYGEQLYNVLLGWAGVNDVYITSDKTSVSRGAVKRWRKVDQQTDDEAPPKKDPYIGKFDDWSQKRTVPRDDDCVVHGDNVLDKGYKDESKIDYYKSLQNKLDNFFRDQVQVLFDEPGFWGRLFGQTPEKQAEKIKNQLLSRGQDKFINYMLGKEQK